MADNLIRIKRSVSSGTPGTALSNGELAYSYNSNSLFIGAQTGPGVAAIQIGGSKYEFLNASAVGVLTPSATIVTEANSFVSNVYTVGLFVGGSRSSPSTNTTHAHITRISPESSETTLGGLGSNAELVTSWAIKNYVDAKVAGGGSFSNGSSYIWSATQTFNANINVNTAVLAVGNTTANVTTNTTHIVVGNGSVNATINSTAFSGTANNATNLGGVAADSYINTSGTYTITGVHTRNANLFVNAATLIVGTASANITANSTQLTVTNATSSASITPAQLTVPSATIGTQITANSTVVNLGTVGNLHATSANAAFQNMTISGNLTVSGTTTTVDTNSLIVKDNVIVVANGNQAATTDVVDFGIVGMANNAGTVYYGHARIASSNLIHFFRTSTVPGTTISSPTTMPVQAFLRPYGANDAFVVNATAIRLVANSTISATIVANTLSLTTALPATSGGTGLNTYTAGDLIYSGATNSLTKLAVGTAGLVLQVNASSLPQWDTLDGGTF